MADSLMDIANEPRTVEVNGKKVPVFGISGRGIVALLNRFPEVTKVFGAGVKPSAEDLMRLAPEAVAALIAAGTGLPGDTAAEEVASNLGLGVQADFVDEIFKATFPRGTRPFLERLQSLGVISEADVEGFQSSKP